jgi:hypothetical protein
MDEFSQLYWRILGQQIAGADVSTGSKLKERDGEVQEVLIKERLEVKNDR